MATDRKSIFWKLSASVEREGDTIRIRLNPGPSGDIFKTLKEYKITNISDEEKTYLKRIIKNNYIICEETILGSASKDDSKIVAIIQSLHIARKVNRDRWKVDMDYIKTQFAKDKQVQAMKKNNKKGKDGVKKGGKFGNNNKQQQKPKNSKFSPAIRKYNRMDDNGRGSTVPKPATIKRKIIIKRKATD